MESRPSLLVYWMVILGVLGNVISIHRNTADIRRPSKPSEETNNNSPRVITLAPASSRQRSGFLLENTIISRNQAPLGVDFLSNSRHRPAHQTVGRQFSPPAGRRGPVVVTTERGNRPPSIPVSQRERTASSQRFSQSQTRASNFNNVNEPVGEPPVLFLNRDRMQRNGMLQENGHGPRVRLPDVQRSSFESQRSFQDPPFQPFEDRQIGPSQPPFLHDSRMPLQSTNQPYYPNTPHERGRHQQMTSPPDRQPDPSFFPRPADPRFSPTDQVPHHPQRYMEMLQSVDEMLDALPIPFRRMLRRRRRMRRFQSLRQFLMRQDPYQRGFNFPP